MKNTIIKFNEFAIRFVAFLLFIGVSFVSFAQNTTGYHIGNDPDGVPNNPDWYSQPWIWAIVAAVLILLIAFLTRRGRGKAMEADKERGVRRI